MGNPVVDAILGATNDAHVRAAMLMGAQLESGMSTGGVGDNGKSFGPYQIYTVAHPNVSPAQAKDPGWATAFMLPAYQAGVNKVTPSLWTADPAKAAATAAYYAERPKVMYPDSRIRSGWPIVQAAMNGQTIGPSTGGAGGGIVTASDPLGINQSVDNAVASFRKGIMVLANMSLFFAAATVGALLVLIGLVLVFRQTSAGGSMGQIKSAAATVNPVKRLGKVMKSSPKAKTPATPAVKGVSEAKKARYQQLATKREGLTSSEDNERRRLRAEGAGD